MNELGGKASFFSYGHLIDKFVLGATSILLSELILKETTFHSRISRFWLGSAVCLLFLSAPWTYKMMIAAWMEIWFVLFAIMAFHSLLSEKYVRSTALYFVACVMHYQWGVVTALVVFFTSLLAIQFSEQYIFGKFIPKFPKKKLGAAIVFGCSLVAAMQEILLRVYVKSQLTSADGSSLLFRIGISGDDVHNGGILGSLQFLGGIRITNCLKGADGGIPGLTLNEKISLFNCGLSVVGTAMISIISVFGLILLFKIYRSIRPFFFIAMSSMIVFVCILQQSLSVHLLGYSYVFSLLFVGGIVGLVEGFYEKSTSNALSLVVLTPIVFAISILSIHISMLEKITG
ncbi:MAG: hypothetical protein EBY22_15975 [Gammaproteobacteria bacterium]|nr:hypothetical protein [Gammaproteobacteria bacterium]